MSYTPEDAVEMREERLPSGETLILCRRQGESKFLPYDIDPWGPSRFGSGS
jgi:hypothetical protein